MNVRTLTSMLACVALSACMTDRSGMTALQPVPQTRGATPHAKEVAAVALKNDSNEDIKFKTFYSYPINPIWVHITSECVKPGAVWDSSIDFNHSDGEVKILAVETGRQGGCSADKGIAPIEFKQLRFANGKLTIDGRVHLLQGKYLQFCAHQSNVAGHTCKYFH